MTYQVTFYWTGMGDPELGIGPFPEVAVFPSQYLQLRFNSASTNHTANLEKLFIIYFRHFIVIQDFRYSQFKYLSVL